MIQALLWKEYREQRGVWLTLAIVGGAALYGLSHLMAPEAAMTARQGPSEPLVAVAMLLAWTYGLVCGSILLAGEQEGATMTFLDMLPLRRLHLWLVKCLIGLILSLGQVAVLTGCLIACGVAENAWQMAGVVLAILGAGVFGMSWGLLFSARGESVLHVIGLAMLTQFLCYCIVGVLSVPCMVVLAFLWPNTPLAPIVLGWLVVSTLLVAPLVGSARLFSRTDRLRAPWAKSLRQRPDRNVWASWVRLLWLNYAQMRRLILGLMMFSLGLGFLLPVAGAAAWPILTLLIGVLCGVTVCGDEQAHGSFRFLGDQRFPLGRVWFIKLGMRFALAVFAAFLLMLPSLILTIFHRLGTHTVEERPPPFFSEVLHSCLVGSVVPTGLHLTIWLLYGFSVGQLSGLLFRKSVVAAFVSLGMSVMLMSLWMPSLLGIGLHFWQIAGVPLILLVTAGTLVPAWVADRLVACGTFVRLGAALTATGLWIAGGLWYRVAEVPDLPDQLDMPAFVASIPQPEQNTAGQLIRSACTKVESLERSLPQRRAKPPNPSPEPISLQSEETLKHGWPKEKTELSAWLDAMFQENWMAELAEVPDLPLGVLDDPRRLTVNSRLDKVQPARLLTLVLAVRGLQQQAAGRDEVFVENLRIGLAISRTLQHDSPLLPTLVGRSTEGVCLAGLDRWLEKLRGHPELLKRVLRTLLRHEAELPDERQPLQAEYLNSLKETPEQLITDIMENRGNKDDPLRQAEIQAAVLAWLFPWEQERHRRILRVDFQGDLHQRREAHKWGGVVLGQFVFRSNHLSRPKRGVARLRASQLKVALRLYQAETGKPAATLDVLVPRYLPAIPTDPFDGQPFRYRLSKGERIGWPGPEPAPPGGAIPQEAAAAELVPLNGMAGMGGAMPPAPPPTRLVPKGQGILWSVGEDGRDDGGVQQGILPSSTQFGEDIIYLVPPPAK
ncbi:MAG: hypothetical protein ACYC6M_15015 [Terriglobales bacterium]